MTTYIENAITEVIPVAPQNDSGEPEDKRWIEQDKIEAITARIERINLRTYAEGLYD